MTARINQSVLVIAAMALLAGSFAAAYVDEAWLFFAPLVLLVIVCLLHYPQLLFYSLIASIPWSAEVHFSDSLGSDLPDEPLMLLTAFTAVIVLLHRMKVNSRKPFHPLLFLLFISVCWWVITACFSTFPVFSVKYVAAKSWYLLSFVALPLLLKEDEKLIRRTAVVLFTSMFIATVVVLCRHFTLGFTFAQINDAVQPWFRNHVNYSALLSLIVPLQFAFLQQTKQRALRGFLLTSLLIVLAALYLSYSRGAWLALIIGLSGFWLIKKGWLFKTFLVFLLLLFAGIAWLRYDDNYLRFAPDHNTTIFHENFSEHLAATYRGKDVSTAERFYRWVAGANMSGEKYLTGFGPTTFYDNYKPYTVPLFRTWVSDNKEHSTVHNYFLLTLIEQGVPGMLLLLLFIGTIFWYAQKIYRNTKDKFWKATSAAVGAILLMQCTLNFLSDLIETDKVGSVFYLCVAVLVMAARSQETEVGIQENQKSY